AARVPPRRQRAGVRGDHRPDDARDVLVDRAAGPDDPGPGPGGGVVALGAVGGRGGGGGRVTRGGGARRGRRAGHVSARGPVPPVVPRPRRPVRATARVRVDEYRVRTR